MADAHQVHTVIKQIVQTKSPNTWSTHFPKKEPPEGYTIGAIAKMDYQAELDAGMYGDKKEYRMDLEMADKLVDQFCELLQIPHINDSSLLPCSKPKLLAALDEVIRMRQLSIILFNSDLNIEDDKTINAGHRCKFLLYSYYEIGPQDQEEVSNLNKCKVVGKELEKEELTRWLYLSAKYM